MSDTVWYFAFGSNINKRVFKDLRNINPLQEEVAKLSDHKLVFDQSGIPLLEPAFASVIPENDTEVWGVLYELRGDDFTRLHLSEGNNYLVSDITVIGSQSGNVDCKTYIGETSKHGLMPSRRYLKLLIEGAIENQFPTHYVRYLQSHGATYVPLLSELTAFVAKTLVRYSGKGKRLNFIIRKSGARQRT